MIFNPYDNEWDLCEEFGSQDEDEDEAEPEPAYDASEDTYAMSNATCVVQTSHFEHSPSHFDHSPPQDDESDDREIVVSLSDLSLFYGFMHSDQVTATTMYKWDDTMMAIGYIGGVAQAPNDCYKTSITSFIGPLSLGCAPPSALWDICSTRDVHKEIIGTCRVYKVQSLYVVVPHSDAQNVTWYFSVITARDALYACRLLSVVNNMTVYGVT
ncbi:hypothetical protein BDQ17DRAFT_1424699 [Cyathus striatus]|nr:hypothetical protein BDQ17DRAFT_1424699 [Cyathus striatus]